MAFDVLNSTTLSSALDDEQTIFAVGSTSNITAGTSLLVVNGEVMNVQVKDDPASGYVQVIRGWGGTKARSHKSGKKVWIGDPDDFQAIKKGTEFLGLNGPSGTLPDYMLPGSRAVDADGNIYVMVELTETVYSGITVLISIDGAFSAAVLASGNQGSVGVMAEPATSDQFAWAQIYGYVSAASEAGGSSGATSAYFPVAATSVSTPAAGLAVLDTSTAVNGFTIHGMFIVGAASSTTTSTTSCTGVTVPLWLNFPYVNKDAPGSS